MAFDPDAFVNEPTKGFDPDAFLSSGPAMVASHQPGEDVREITAGGMARGALEGVGSLASSAVAYPAGLVAGAIDLARGKSADAAARQKRLVQEGLTYYPRTPEGQGLVNAVGRLMQPWTATADYVGRKTGEATGMPNLGGAVGEAFGLVVNPLSLAGLTKSGTKTVAPRVAETPEAALLRSHGVEGLTTGQRAGAGSYLGQLESVSADNWMGMAPQREAAKQSWRSATVRQALKDKTTPLPNDTARALKVAYDAFGPEYDAIRAVNVDPAKLGTLPQAATVPGRGLTDSVRASAGRAVEDALSSLKDQNGALPVQPTVGDLQTVRSVIRQEKSAAVSANDYAKIRALSHAEGVVTAAMEDALGPRGTSVLRDADRRFKIYSTIEEASPRGQHDFTPNQILRSNERNTGRRSVKHGRANGLQDLGEAAAETFVDAPFTGGRGAVLGAIPFGHKLVAPAMRIANTPGMQRFLFDPRSEVVTGVAPLRFLRGSALSRALEAKMGGLGLSPLELRLQMAAAHERGDE